MKALILFLISIASPCLGDVTWSHRVTEGQDGGIAGSYFFYKTFQPARGDGTLMSVEKVRALYVGNGANSSTVIDYSIETSGILVKVSKADKEHVMQLISGKDAELKFVSEFSIKGDLSVGEFSLKSNEALTGEQQSMILNLVYILSMQRSPIIREPSDAAQPSTAAETKSVGK